MPIYAYKCSSCGHEQDVLQKMSDPVLTNCPACAQSTYVKQLTAAGFQLKGTGWYVTDFRNNDKGAAKGAAAGASTSAGDAGASTSAGDAGASSSTAAAATAGSAPAAE